MPMFRWQCARSLAQPLHEVPPKPHKKCARKSARKQATRSARARQTTTKKAMQLLWNDW